MKYLKNTVLFFLLLAANIRLQAQNIKTVLFSPDKRVAMKVIIQNNKPYYTVEYNHYAVIAPSEMGLEVNHQSIAAITAIKTHKVKVINETYPWRGVHSKATDHCNVETISFQGVESTIAFEMEVEVFNNGVAFRYIIPNKDSVEVNADRTSFTIPAKSIIWSQNDISYYEGEYTQQNIEDVKEGQLAGPPLTVKLPGSTGYAAITEGGLTNFTGMSLIAAGSNAFKANLATDTHVVGTIKTPWRIIEIGKDLNSLVNCDIIADVSPKPDKTLFPNGFATPWIKPGKSVWSWLAGNGGVTFENMELYSKWAGELGIEYNLVDDGWGKWHDGAKDNWALIKELVDYSKQYHVKIWIWKAYSDRDGIPGIKDPKVRWEFLNKCKEAGVAGVKIDFLNSESQEVINFYQVALKDAAKLHLMLDFHGADKPTGQSRTWPNEMTREGIRGLEYGKSVPKDNTTLPFTRFLAGHADYTPLTLKPGMMNGTTLMQQVATVLTFTSPFMCLGVNPEKLLMSPIQEMIVQMPTTWDETIVLPQSKIGELAVFARRKGKTWYLSVLNGEHEKTLNINFSFLKSGTYHATVMCDNENSSENIKVINKNYDKTNAITVRVPSGGGFVVKFIK